MSNWPQVARQLDESRETTGEILHGVYPELAEGFRMTFMPTVILSNAKDLAANS
jgi:hypothetical protein